MKLLTPNRYDFEVIALVMLAKKYAKVELEATLNGEKAGELVLFFDGREESKKENPRRWHASKNTLFKLLETTKALDVRQLPGKKFSGDVIIKESKNGNSYNNIKKFMPLASSSKADSKPW